MKHTSYKIGLVCAFLLFLFAAAAVGQEEDQEKPAKVISYDPSLTGETGIISTLVADSLPKGKFSIGLFYHNFDRELTDLDVNQYAISFAYGLLDNLEIAMSVIGAWQVDYDKPPMIYLFPPRVLTAFPFPIHTVEEGFGDVYLGAKYTFLQDSDTSPGLALRGFLKVPTGNEAEGFGSGATDFGADFIVSKHLGNSFLVTGNLGMTFLGTPESFSGNNLSFGQDFRWGVGTKAFVNLNWRFIAELTGVMPMGDDDFPQQNIVDFRFGTEFKLNSGLRFGLGYTRALIFDEPSLRGDGAYAMITYSPWKGLPEIPEWTRRGLVKISGYVFEESATGSGLPGVSLTFSSAGPTATTDSSGYYEGLVKKGWSGVVTPAKADYTFQPPSRSYEAVKVDLKNQNYIAYLKKPEVKETFAISGNVREGKADGPGIPGVKIDFGSAGSVTTDNSGFYKKEVDKGWSGKATPSLADYTFEPAERTYGDIAANQEKQDYVGYKPYQLVDVYFDFDSYELRPEAIKDLAALVEYLERKGEIGILIEGHCCYIGTEEYNLALGEMRAKSIMNYLVTAGVAESRIEVKSWGELKPEFDNSKEETRRFNRRGHFLVREK